MPIYEHAHDGCNGCPHCDTGMMDYFVAVVAAITPIYVLLYRVETRLTRLECVIDPAGCGDGGGDDPPLIPLQR